MIIAYIRKYNEEGSEPVIQDVSKVKGFGVKLIQRNLSIVENDSIRHNSDAIATTIVQLICDDLKFNDMQNDAQFMMLDNRIKNTNKKLKKQNKNSNNKKERTNSNNNRTSKFYEKYNERIKSIQESSEKKINKKKATARTPRKKKTEEAPKQKTKEGRLDRVAKHAKTK